MVLYLIVNLVIVVALGFIARSIGQFNKTGGGWNFDYSTRDIVIIAVIAAIAGVVNTGTSTVWTLANSSMGPLGGALLQGAFMWAYILAAWLVRKPGAALAVGIIEVAVEVLLGNPTGIASLGWGVTQGLGIEIVLALVNYRKFDLITAICAGAAASQLGTVWTAILFGWDPAFAGDVWLAVPVNLISGAILSGVIGHYLAQAIARTGLVRAAAT